MPAVAVGVSTTGALAYSIAQWLKTKSKLYALGITRKLIIIRVRQKLYHAQKPYHASLPGKKRSMSFW